MALQSRVIRDQSQDRRQKSRTVLEISGQLKKTMIPVKRTPPHKSRAGVLICQGGHINELVWWLYKDFFFYSSTIEEMLTVDIRKLCKK